ncbi:MAG TPA: PHP domain-containing protein [bacterium]|nr:PHP domain-containing protein [bacterium]HOC88142.1 PHP domain-containing protein [bacterium]HOZ20342.1 PHP domain-containing protein [bacterium]
MLRWYVGDLHIHTVLSPCSELTMGPQDIVRTAIHQGLDFIAITDHNSAENVPAVQRAAQGTRLQVFPGIEVSTREEIHMITLFPALEQLFDFQEWLYSQLQEGENDPSLWGPQLVVDERENIVAENMRLLGLPIHAPYDQVVRETVAREGIIYPAHIDRRANSMVRTLGFLPADLPFRIVELSRRANLADAVERYSGSGMQLITASDAHDVEQIGTARSWFRMSEPSFPELLLACRGENGRQIAVLEPEEAGRSGASCAAAVH